MKRRTVTRALSVVAAAIGVLCVPYALMDPPSDTDASAPGVELGDPEAVSRLYGEFAENYAEAGGSRNLLLALGWSKALSAERTTAHGQAHLDLIAGNVEVEVEGLDPTAGGDVWLIDNQPAPHDTVAPEPHDRYIFAGRLDDGASTKRLVARLGREAFADFDVDMVVVARKGEEPGRGGLLYGSPTLFQRLYRQAERESLGLPASPDGAATAAVESRGAILDTLSNLFSTSIVRANHDESPLVSLGRRLFFEEEFSGNGRTCGSCHPAENNLTIDPTFIEALPNSDALFVAEFTPALATGFENPELMRKVGLIFENTDGFANPGTMRGVPHTLALPTSLAPAVGDGTTIPPNQRTGWGGDGAPGGGTLRDFATGAVTQHFPKTLGRVNGIDFVLPNDGQLNAMEAFQLSLGRQADIDLGAIVFTSEVVTRGQKIFTKGFGNGDPDPAIPEGKCFACHLNAGANDFFLAGKNANFDTGVEDLPNQPADLIDPAGNPPDEGFGTAPHPSGGFGNGSFNSPPLIEAADTGPFFHNNSIETIEEAVNFYNSDAFNAAFGAVIGGIDLQPTEVVAVAALLRVLNADENIREAAAQVNRAKTANNLSNAKPHIRAASDETEDGIEVLRCGRLHPKAVRSLVEARILLEKANGETNNNRRNNVLNQVVLKLRQARNDMIVP